MVVRPITLSDSREVASLSNQLGYPSSASVIEKRLGKMTLGAEFGAFVAEATDGAIAGWIHVFGVQFLQEDAFAEISGLVVSANSQGQGVGKALLEAAEKWARENGYTGIYVRSNTKRSQAPPFYERRGYNTVKTQYVFHKGF
jgi:GNAT superfamily N-acetyltransferase